MGIKEIGATGAVLVIALLLAVGIFNVMGGGIEINSNEITGNAVANNGNVQEVILSFSSYGYIVDPPSVKAGTPVKMIADMNSLYGCMKAVRIPELGISKNVYEGDNIIEFTPTQPGTYKITCSMGMGVGQIIVE